MDIKPIDKRASGQAFEVILKPSSPVSDSAHCVTSAPKRDLSLEDIQKKLEAAEDRRRVRSRPLVLLFYFIYRTLRISARLRRRLPAARRIGKAALIRSRFPFRRNGRTEPKGRFQRAGAANGLGKKKNVKKGK